MRVSVAKTGRKLSRIRVKRLAAALIRVAGGSLFFVLLAATLGLPGEKRSPHSGLALAGTQPPARRVGSTLTAPSRDVPRLASLAIHAEVSEPGYSFKVAECERCRSAQQRKRYG